MSLLTADWPSLLLAVAAIAAGSVVQRISGVGGGFIAVPVVAMIDVGFVPGPLVLASIMLSSLMAWREWSHVDWRNIPAIMTGFVPGSAAGAWLLTTVAPGELGLVFGGVILFAVLITVSGLHPRLNPVTGAAAGVVAGVMGTSTAIGAPPLAILYHRQSGPMLRATLAVIYTICSLLIVLMLLLFGRFGSNDLLAGVLLVPGFVLGFWLGGPLVRRLDGRGLSNVVLLVSAAAAVALIIKSL